MTIAVDLGRKATKQTKDSHNGSKGCFFKITKILSVYAFHLFASILLDAVKGVK